MESAPQFFTATMARLYMGQGYYGKAVEIYSHLLSREPERQDLADSLAAAREALRQEAGTDRERLAALFARWFDLAGGCGSLAGLERLRQHVSAGRTRESD